MASVLSIIVPSKSVNTPSTSIVAGAAVKLPSIVFLGEYTVGCLPAQHNFDRKFSELYVPKLISPSLHKGVWLSSIY